MLTASAIKARAGELGFDACGVAPAANLPELSFLADWISRGYAGSMEYLERTASRRADVRQVMPTAKTVIVTATVYNTRRPYSIECGDVSRGHVARYAWGDDYHDVIGERLERLLEWMHESSSEPFDAKVFVDSGPVQERVYAQHAGLGWIGKNTCVIHPMLGSWVLLGEIVCSLPLDLDPPSTDQCGDCRLCIEACPTQAIVQAGVLDATRCISYLTIEHRGELPEDRREAIGAHVYGCDICQEVCPWNQSAPVSDDAAWQPRPAWDLPSLLDLHLMSDEYLDESLSGSAMRRAKPAGIRRNIEIAIENALKMEKVR